MDDFVSLEHAAPAAPLTARDFRPLVPPIQLSTTFLGGSRELLDDGAPLLYRRQANPAHFPIEERLADLEGGEASLLFSSGMAAITSVLRALGRGDELILPRSVYWTLRVWLDDFRDTHAFTVRWVDSATVDEVRAQLTPATRLIWIEAPANPSLRLPDIEAIAAIKPPHALLAVDATCASPALLRPMDLGADLVVHSISKCISGHNDLLGGVVSTARRDPFWHRVKTLRWVTGNALGPIESHLLARSLETLTLRMQAASESALAVARYLEQQPAVLDVIYPGLPSHPDHALARRTMTHGHGCLIGIVLKGGAEACLALCKRTRVWRNATSFGGVTSLLEHRSSAEYRIKQSADDYVRLSVGLEPVDQLIRDLHRAFAPARSAVAAPEPLVVAS